MNSFLRISCLFILVGFASCKKDNSSTSSSNAKLIISFSFDSTQQRLNNIGQPATIASGHAAQNLIMNKMSAHYIELAPNALTQLGAGAVLYKAPETTAGGSSAIDFDQSVAVANNQVFFEIPISQIPPGDYEWLRISLAYQNGDIKFLVDTTINSIHINQLFTGTLASFIGFDTYIKTYTIKTQTLTVNSNELQGYWGFETILSYNGLSYPFSTSGQAPAGATTVVNPLFASSPIPAGSCVVTAAFQPGKLTITGNETKDINVNASFSTNNSFEWVDVINDGMWEPSKGESVVDMGIRGMIPTIQ
jgi:hypothetical protein